MNTATGPSWKSTILPRVVMAAFAISTASCGGATADADVSQDAGYTGPLATVSGACSFLDDRVGGNYDCGPLVTDVILSPLLHDWIEGTTPPLPPVARARSDAQGHYVLSAPPGDYTVLLYYKGALEPQSLGGDGLNAVHLEVGRPAVKDLRVDSRVDPIPGSGRCVSD